ncbi:hypothetical protein [Singulisphaera acidiphila]|uniref:Uncharacterized protein n=1 Tax=Singulisphaera acidiphila (strain ATCC BAA-1392 / DSM 18658 / VKM B-2454 / MOB10) TaxID=886293 RepID=L0D855_SINAD|nr:hypothetical protein [Singulisphaera acidiphila]AGA25397.1 hypothetical protein Sinac_0995 [Singulisphaera acidiphila DSM 18658]
MPKGNSERHNGGTGRGGPERSGDDRGVRDRVQAVGQQIHEGAAQVGQRLSEGYGSASEAATRRLRRAEGMVARNPAPSVLIGFGIGFGLGLVLTTLLARPEETWAERHLPDRLRHAPDSLSNLAGSLRNLPESISRHIPRAMRSS